MYEVFDNFIIIDTWHTQHPLDEKRFFIALQKVVHEDKFNADEMADYIQTKTGNNPGFESAVAHYCAAAWAVAGYLTATDE